jgi:hypothetical protein
LLILLYFKWFLAPSNDILSGQSIFTFERILSPFRYFHIIRFGLETLFAKYYILLIVFALTFRYRSSFTPEIWIILWVLLAYLTVYLITPRDLIWHLSTSMKRLYYHLYPSTLYLILASTDLKKWEEYLEKVYFQYFKKKYLKIK